MVSLSIRKFHDVVLYLMKNFGRKKEQKDTYLTRRIRQINWDDKCHTFKLSDLQAGSLRNLHSSPVCYCCLFCCCFFLHSCQMFPFWVDYIDLLNRTLFLKCRTSYFQSPVISLPTDT